MSRLDELFEIEGGDEVLTEECDKTTLDKVIETPKNVVKLATDGINKVADITTDAVKASVDTMSELPALAIDIKDSSIETATDMAEDTVSLLTKAKNTGLDLVSNIGNKIKYIGNHFMNGKDDIMTELPQVKDITDSSDIEMEDDNLQSLTTILNDDSAKELSTILTTEKEEEEVKEIETEEEKQTDEEEEKTEEEIKTEEEETDEEDKPEEEIKTEEKEEEKTDDEEAIGSATTDLINKIDKITGGNKQFCGGEFNDEDDEDLFYDDDEDEEEEIEDSDDDIMMGGAKPSVFNQFINEIMGGINGGKRKYSPEAKEINLKINEYIQTKLGFEDWDDVHAIKYLLNLENKKKFGEETLKSYSDVERAEALYKTLIETPVKTFKNIDIEKVKEERKKIIEAKFNKSREENKKEVKEVKKEAKKEVKETKKEAKKEVKDAKKETKKKETKKAEKKTTKKGGAINFDDDIYIPVDIDI